MVAQPWSTVAQGSVSMVAWALWVFLLLSGTIHAHASGLKSGRFSGDVSDDEVMIDKLKDFLNSRQRSLHLLGSSASAQVPAPASSSSSSSSSSSHSSSSRHQQQAPDISHPSSLSHPSHQEINEKIEFAVTPKDPRYYLPAQGRDSSNPAAEILRYLSPGIDYTTDLLQYDDLSYPAEYPSQYRPQYPYPQHQQEPRHPDYLTPQDLPFPAGGIYPPNLRNPRLLEEDEEVDEERERGMRREMDEERERGMRGEVDDTREAVVRDGMLEGGDYTGDDGELMMKKGEVEGEKEVELDAKKLDAGAIDTESSPKLPGTSQPEALPYQHLRRAPPANHQAAYTVHEAPLHGQEAQLSDLYFTALVAGCTAVAVCGVVGAGICWYRLNKSHRAAQDAEYPAYGVTGPNKDISPSGDRKLAQSAHMYHYQHQKQQMIALEKSAGGERHGSTSDVDSEEEGEENEYTVYECPGLAPTGEMEVKNPLFHDDPTPTPATPAIRKDTEQEHEDQDHHQQEDLTSTK